ncbi:hypothetical protein ACN4EK_10845 [Pantanalinema rosaneae CENA516]|uniref:hypothetical protein n=1 Tax=Pantanalinema rosaneae TaxID=1620701 RepID=UPI003D6ED98B
MTWVQPQIACRHLGGQSWSVRVATLLMGLLASGWVSSTAAQAQGTPYCQQLTQAIAQKETLRKSAVQGNKDAQAKYKALLTKHAEALRQCRSRNWPQNQAIWIRLYPCDARPGALEAVLDKIVNRGYNQVYVEVFYNGMVLLPANRNPTPWPTVLQGSGWDNVDLLEQVIRQGRERGLKVHTWLFSMNFGANYVRRIDRQATLSRNGLGQTSLTANTIAGLSVDFGAFNPYEAFIDPYSAQARTDYTGLVRAFAQYRPDGMLFDYIRYPRGSGAASVASKVQDLWVYGESSQRSLLQRAMNYRGMELIQRFLNKGFLSADDLKASGMLYPGDPEPLWQGLNPGQIPANLPVKQRLVALNAALWQLAVAHASQGVVDFLVTAIRSVEQQGISTGAVFFPDGNITVGQSGFDSRLQFWERFPQNADWHPMAYGTCGNTTCIMQQIQRVLQRAPSGVQVKPVLAGIWQRSAGNRPPLEHQMQALYKIAPSLTSVSHFAYSWQEPGSDHDRKYCKK